MAKRIQKVGHFDLKWHFLGQWSNLYQIYKKKLIWLHNHFPSPIWTLVDLFIMNRATQKSLHKSFLKRNQKSDIVAEYTESLTLFFKLAILRPFCTPKAKISTIQYIYFFQILPDLIHIYQTDRWREIVNYLSFGSCVWLLSMTANDWPYKTKLEYVELENWSQFDSMTWKLVVIHILTQVSGSHAQKETGNLPFLFKFSSRFQPPPTKFQTFKQNKNKHFILVLVWQLAIKRMFV